MSLYRSVCVGRVLGRVQPNQPQPIDSVTKLLRLCDETIELARNLEAQRDAALAECERLRAKLAARKESER